MRVLLVGAGADFSVRDVESGYLTALREVGADVRLYALDHHLGVTQRWLNWQWRERGKRPDQKPTWPDVIYRGSVEAFEMALRLEVDWVLVISGMFFHPDVVEMMRRAGKRVAVLFTESPYQDEQQSAMAELVDVCWTTERTSVRTLRQANPNTSYLRHAYDPVRHTTVAELNADVPSHDVVFVGSGFQERIDTLAAVDWTGIDLGLYGEWGLLPSRHRLRKYVRGGLRNNVDAVALYRQAKIGLNLYRTSKNYSRTPERIEHAESMNPRAYELAACGVFQISDRRAEGFETFAYSVPTFRTPEDLAETIRQFLPHDKARHSAAISARRLIQPHTFAARAAQILADLEAYEQPIAKGA